ncbi:MAG: class I SAM-dependent methyltransferase [Thaumarchaeota archaeon]|nr:class I SAM-dependent methyltransferase [Candidatus Calditenuaceae archaeon]MDW8186547.1 class I SAM-dependent methyltransferase [Nitrososphaerota archaeon]
MDPWESVVGFATIWTAHLGRRYGVLKVLGELRRPLSSSELAKTTGLNPETVRLWCEAASKLGLIGKRGGRYYLPSRIRSMLLDERDPRYVGGALSYLALRSLDFHLFDVLFRPESGTKGKARHLSEAFREATKWDHLVFFEHVVHDVRGLERRLDDGARALDLGCGTGGWAMELCSRYPNVTAVGVDLDEGAIAEARRRAKEAGLSGRVRFVAAYGESLGLKDEFDLVYLGEVLCVAEDRLGLLMSAHRALKPGGHVIVAEGLSDRTDSLRHDRLLKFLALDYALQGGSMLSKRELSSLLKRAGFRIEKLIHSGGGLWFVVAKKARVAVEDFRSPHANSDELTAKAPRVAGR